MKKHDKELEVLELEILYKRLLNESQKEKVLQKLKIKKAEVWGEREIEFPLQFLDQEKYLIMHNLRIPDDYGFFQIDTLLLTRSYLLILEVKNWQGKVIFSENGQVTRILEEQETGFQNPISQVKMQKYRLSKWLQNNHFPNMPITFLVVISSPKTIIHASTQIPKEVIHNADLFFKITQLEQHYTDLFLEQNELMELATQLKEEHTKPSNIQLVNKQDIAKGVICPQCDHLPMIRRKRKWYCELCKHYSSTAHLSSLFEYSLLFGDTITNKEARDFLNIDSPDVARRLLAMAGFPATGNTKDRMYSIPPYEWWK